MSAGTQDPAALDLVEEATHLVRCVPLSAGAAYGLGVVPFVLGAAFFVADMSRGAYAAAHLPGAALALVAAFAWMKAWQAVAAEHALAFLEQRAAAPLNFRSFLGLMGRQFTLHAFGLVLLPVSFVLSVPGGWFYAYFQNLTVLGSSAAARTHRMAMDQARLWPGQNHLALGAILILGLLVFVNIGAALYTVPWLIRTITGTERVFAQTGWNPLNTTFLAATSALTFLVMDPVLKAFYVLRCFYGVSRRSGVDLLVQVRTAVARASAVAGIGLVLFCGTSGHVARADEASPPTAEVERTDQPGQVLSPETLDTSLDRVLSQPDYIWREPPKTKPEGAVHDFVAWLDELMNSIGRWWRRLLGGDGEEGEEPAGGSSGFFAFGGTLYWLVLALVAIAVVAVVAMLVLQRRADPAAALAAGTRVTPVPTLEGDDVTADQLPEEEWLRLARALLAQGDFRLGLRALFLGSLAGLAARGLLSLARHKSNRDYERELLRRGAPLGALVSAFVDNRRSFEGVWYGGRVPAPEDVARFEENVLRLVRRDQP